MCKNIIKVVKPFTCCVTCLSCLIYLFLVEKKNMYMPYLTLKGRAINIKICISTK